MVRKIKKWVPVCGNRWRNEVADGHEYHGLVVHYVVAHGGDMAPLRELPTAGWTLWFVGVPSWAFLALFFIKYEIETHYDVDNRSTPRGEPL